MKNKNQISLPTWAELKALARWTPLQQVPYSGTCIAEGLYKIAPSMFITAGDYDQQLQRRDDGPFIGSVMWAATDGAAKRIGNSDIEADVDENPIVPPSDMLLLPTAKAYVEIRTLLETGKFGRYRELSTFRKDGKRICNSLENRPWKFCFRGVRDDGQTLPFAITYVLPGPDVKFAGMDMSRLSQERTGQK